MARPARIDLQSFQQELANRLASKTAAQVESSRLGLACGGERFLIRLGDAAEVVAVPPIAAVPLTQPWFLGLANIRGNLYSVVDFAAFVGREAIIAHGTGGQSRLILFGSRAGDLRPGSSSRAFSACATSRSSRPRRRCPMRLHGTASAGSTRDGGTWQEIELARLVVDPAFLRVGL
jgi:twitching motility protein PilI